MRQEEVAAVLRERGDMTIREVVEALGVDYARERPHTDRSIRMLVRYGLVAPVGLGPAPATGGDAPTIWRWVG